MISPSAKITVLLLWLSMPLSATAEQPVNPDGGYQIDTSSRAVVSLFYKTVFLSSEDVDSGWNGNIQNCDAGDTSADYKAAVLRRINWFRAMAGVPANVELDPALNAKAQQAALLMSANRALSHYPPSNWTCYGSDANEAAGKSNLSLGSAGPDAMVRFMLDEGGSNYPVGHRRWLLHPQTLKMGTGDVLGSVPSNAHWVVTSSYSLPRPEVRDEFVAWPPPGYVPFEVVFPRWSISYPRADFSAATVTMTRGGMPVPAKLETVRDGFGENTLAWFADGFTDHQRWTRPVKDTQYDVVVANVVIAGEARTFSYSVTVFDPEQQQELPTFIAEVGTQNDSSARIFQTSSIEGALQYQWRQAMVSPFSLRDTADTGLANFNVQHNPGYQPHIESDPNGESYFRLAHPNGLNRSIAETLELNEELLVGTGAQLQYKSRRGLSTNNQIAAVDVSTDGGVSWQSIYRNEVGSQRELFFSENSVSLAPWQGRLVRLRFKYTFECDSSCTFYPYAEGRGHWDIDDIRLSGVEKVSVAALSTPQTGPQIAFTPIQAGRQILQSRAGMYGEFSSWGSAYILTVAESQLHTDQDPSLVIQPPSEQVVPLPGADSWPGYYNGVSPDPALGLPYNNIGILDLSANKAYSCVRFLFNGEPSDMDGIEHMDITFELISLESGTLQVRNARAFNPGNALTELAEWPECSGTFDMSTGEYVDFLQLDNRVFRTEFELVDEALLLFELTSAEEVLP
jgi:uncharacterized protein YkwD